MKLRVTSSSCSKEYPRSIEVNTIHDILRFADKVGPIIIFPNEEGWSYNPDYRFGIIGGPCIEIYDGYRE